MKKLAALMLAMLMLTGTLASCGGGADTPAVGDDTADTTAAEAVETTVPESTRAPLEVPEKNYDGYKFRVLEYTKGAPGKTNQYFNFGWESDASGDLINDAVKERNMIVEERLGITITYGTKDNVTSEAKTLILAGSDDYDIYLGYINNSFPLAQEGLLVDLYEVPYINLEAEWWDQPAIRDMAIGGTMYVGLGDATIADEELNYCIFFNKTVAREYNVKDQYQLVRDGKFTLDAMVEASKDVTRDLNGDGVLDQNDAFGILTSPSLGSVYFIAAGGRMSELKDGTPELVLNTPENVDKIEKLTNFFADKNLVLDAADTARCPDSWNGFNTMLTEDRALYRVGSVYNIQSYRDMVNDFGILPYPKYDEAQEEHSHLIATQVCSAITIPATAKDIERTGIIVESLAYESKDTVTKAYYDINLYTKVARDDESGEMFDIIFATKCYDLAKVFNWGGLETVINNATKGQAFASLYAGAESAAQTALETSMKFFAK